MSQVNTPYRGLRRNPWKEFVFPPVPVENLGMTRVFTGFQNNWEEVRSGHFISIGENFLSGVVLVKWEMMSKALQLFFFFKDHTSEYPLGSRTHHFPNYCLIGVLVNATLGRYL